MRKILQGARKAAGMTQKQTAQTVGVSERTYQRIEAGTREGKARVWDKLETMFCLPQRQLRGDCGNDITTEDEDDRVNVQAIPDLCRFVADHPRMVTAAIDLADGHADTPEGTELAGLIGRLAGGEGGRI